MSETTPEQTTPEQTTPEQTTSEQNKALVGKAFDTLFNNRDYAAAEQYWSDRYIQHSAHIPPGRDGLFDLVRSAPAGLRHEPGLILANKEFVMIHGRFSGTGRPRNWVAVDIVRIANGVIAEHWDVLQDEATRDESRSGRPMFGEGWKPPKSSHTHDTAPTRFVEANGIRFAYRRFGNPAGVPIVLNQHFKGTMDYWDPAVTDGLANGREVILFNNAGVASSSGEVPASFPAMGANAIAFIRALGLAEADVLGVSIGGMVAQEMALQAPRLVRKVILVGTGPRGADMAASQSADIFAGVYEPPEHLWLAVLFSPSEAGRAAGLAFLERKLRRADRDPEVSENAAARQREAIGNYMSAGETAQDHLKDIRQPTLIVQGSDDVIIPTINSYVLQQKLPNAQLIVYPDANHGSFYQYPDLFVRHATLFLDA